MAKDSHLTTEQLSAYLDAALSPRERTTVEQHLLTCTQCQQQLTGLRQTVALLHALPEPALPRSFVLSHDMLVRGTQGRQQEHGGRLLPFPATQRRTRPTYAYNTARFVSIFAALIGIFLLGTGLLPTLPRLNPMAGSASSSASSGTTNPAISTRDTGKNNTGTGSVGTPNVTHAMTPNATKPENIGPKPAQPSVQPLQSLLPFFDITQSQGQKTVGILLLVLGIISLLALRWRRQRVQV